MASNAARKLAPEQIHQPRQPEDAEIQRKKEIKKKEIKDVFEEARDRVQGKGEEIDQMQADLTNLLNQIPNQEDADFQARLKEFAFKFKVVKEHLKKLAEESQLEQLPSGAFTVLEDEDVPVVPQEAFRTMEINGLVFPNGDKYSGSAIPLEDGSYKLQGEGTLQKTNGVVLEGFFEENRLKDGHFYTYLDDGRDDVQFVQDGKVVRREIGNFDKNQNLLNGEVVDAKNGKVLEIWKNGKLESDKTGHGPRHQKIWYDGKPEGHKATIEIGPLNNFELNLEDEEEIAVLNGVITDDGNGGKSFQGKIEFKNYDNTDTGFSYVGEAVILNDEKIKYEGQGTLTSNHEISQGIWKDGGLFEGQVRDKKTGKLIEARRNGNAISLISQAMEKVAGFFKGFGRKEKTASRESQAQETEDQPDLLIEDDDGFKHLLKGQVVENAQGVRSFKGKIKSSHRSGSYTSEYDGIADISPDNKIIFQGEGTLDDGQEITKGVWENDMLKDGEVRNKEGELLQKIENGKVVPFDRSVEPKVTSEPVDENLSPQSPEAEVAKSKEKGRLGKLADVVFSKAGAKIASEAAYKTTASILGVKLGTDALIAGVAAVLEKRAGTKDLAAKIGEYSDVHKFLVGKNEINAIKEGFAEFVKTLNPEDGEDFELNVVDEKYSALKAKIESAGQIDPEAKGKLLVKLETIKQNFDADNKKLENEEKNEAEKYLQAYLVNKTAGMQLFRDGLNGATKLVVVASGGVAAGGALLAKQAAIGRVMGMATTKIIERGQKNKKFNEQMKVEEKEAVGTLNDFKFALLETMHGLSGGVFNEGKDVKTGKELNEMQRFGNFAKSLGNVLVAVGVTLGVKGETISSVMGDFMHKFQGAKGGDVHEAMMNNVAAKMPEAQGVNADNAPVAAAIAVAEAKVVAASQAGVETSAEASVAEQAAGTPGETMFVKDASKVHDFSSWRRQMMESMGYKFEGGKIGHALTFHKGAKIELVGHDGKVVDTYTFKKGGSTWDAMDKFHRDHADLFKGKDAIPAINIIDTGDDKHHTVEVLDKYKMESHRSGHSVFKEGGATAKSGLDKVVSGEKLPKAGLHEQKIGVGPNIQKGIPAGWAAASEEGPNGQAMVNGFVDKNGHARFLIHSTDSSSEFDVDRDMRMVDASSGKIFDLDGNHVGGLDFKPADSLSTSTTADRIVWSNGGNVAEKVQADLKGHILHQPAEKSTSVENTTKVAKSSSHGGGGAPKEKVVYASAEQATSEERPRVKAYDIEDKPKGEVVAVQEEVDADKPAEAEPTPVVKEITSLADGREAIAALEYLDAEEKTRLSNFSYLLQWQHDLYGQNGSTLRNMLEGQDAFGTLGKDQINSMMAELAHNNELASREFMKAVADHQPYDKIIEKLNDKMPGYAMFHDEDNSSFVDKIMKTDLSQNVGENKAAFRDLELARVKEMVDQAEVDKLMKARQARK